MGPAEIAGHLDERFRLLTGGRRGRVERHQTLRAAVEWSYSLLADTERTVFDRLGVFPASFDEAAAVAVCAGDGIERWDVIDALASLVAKSMVGAERSGDTTRYQLLETLRHFARDRIAAGGDLDGLRRRHAAHYAGFAERAGAGLMSPDELVWRPRLAAELDNLRAATGWAFDAASLDDVALGCAGPRRTARRGRWRSPRGGSRPGPARPSPASSSSTPRNAPSCSPRRHGTPTAWDSSIKPAARRPGHRRIRNVQHRHDGRRARGHERQPGCRGFERGDGGPGRRPPAPAGFRGE